LYSAGKVALEKEISDLQRKLEKAKGEYAEQKKSLPENIQTIVDACVKSLEDATTAVSALKKNSDLDASKLNNTLTEVLHTLDKLAETDTAKRLVLQKIEKQLSVL
jgi:hypothetical protein